MAIMTPDQISQLISILQDSTQNFSLPSVSQMALLEKDRPFRVLISCILSLRTKDEVTFKAATRLFDRAKNLEGILKLERTELETLIFPVGFYRNKAKQILEICQTLLDHYKGRVPEEIEELLQFKGVGRKTANLVRTLGYGKSGICVDTHVHRISNRLGLVKTKTPDETEFALRKILPESYWIEYNDLLVTWGQNICKPISPLCSQCTIVHFCQRIGVEKSR